MTTGNALFCGLGLEIIPEQILSTKNMTHLDVSCNGISSLPRGVAKLQALRTLDLKDNLLSDVPVELSMCTALHTLNLDGNKFKDFTGNICGMHRLQILTAQRNELTALSCDLANMVGLIFLDLQNNPGLSEVAQKMLNEGVERLMSYLKSVQIGLIYGGINLSRRGLVAFPIEVYIGCDRVTSLTLSHNEIVSLPAGIAHMVSLTALDVSFNSLKSLPEEIGKLVKLIEMYADDNQLACLPDAFLNLSKLQTLSLERNPFKKFPCSFMQRWKDLATLTLDTEQIVTLPDGAVHTSTELMPLEVISLGMQRCVEYRQRLRQCLVTGRLDLSVMALWFVPVSVTRMQLLTSLNFTGNCLLMLPGEILIRLSVHSLCCVHIGMQRLTLLDLNGSCLLSRSFVCALVLYY